MSISTSNVTLDGWIPPKGGSSTAPKNQQRAGPINEQVGGSHYKDMAIQPVEYIHRNGLGFIEGCVVKYVSRWRVKGGVEDLRKARHFIDLLIELEAGIQ